MLPMKNFAILLLLTALGLTGAFASEIDDGSAVSLRQSGELYLPSDNPSDDLHEALVRASANNKRVLVVMGANWCHDSRALASRLYLEPLATLIAGHYEVVFVDVGYLEKGRDLITGIGPPVYYATPTVLILDPASGQLVNAGNRHQWGDAYSISMEESVAYFQTMAALDLSTGADEAGTTGELAALLSEIDAWEQLQADRVYAAYSVIGPMLRAYKEGNEPEHFEEYWSEVRDFRMKVPLDADGLRKEARERLSAGESSITLNYPKYPGFSW